MKEAIFKVVTPQDFKLVAEHVLAQSNAVYGATLLCLLGELGAGKTTFTQQLAKQLGVVELVTSPTFGIMKSYEITNSIQFDQLVHIDAYRIDDISEVGPLRIEELFQRSRTLICLEWPEQIAEILPKEKIHISIQIKEGEERSVIVSKE